MVLSTKKIQLIFDFTTIIFLTARLSKTIVFYVMNPILVLYNHKIEQKLHTANKQIQFETKTKQSVFVLVLIVLSI